MSNSLPVTFLTTINDFVGKQTCESSHEASFFFSQFSIHAKAAHVVIMVYVLITQTADQKESSSLNILITNASAHKDTEGKIVKVTGIFS